ncbi:GNAT family N-acetyltransferase [Spirochaeta cellobiosiphila]|uniref:GNAT family N-acetyltransferase n=1 Tax=Spirochaeta cellobiosiphila TaxID=504483 RepID=UPI0004140AB0|nr:GNAT family protein [Spirochaeta cellobiosiphila]
MEISEIPECLEGTRVLLKKHDINNAKLMYELVVRDRERLSKFLPWPKKIEKVEDEEMFIKYCLDSWASFTACQYAIYLKETNQYIGNIGAFNFDTVNDCCEIGYLIFSEFEGRGYIIESLTILEKTLFSMGFHRLYILCDPANSKSNSIPKRLNYYYEGIQRESAKYNDMYNDLEVYSKLAEG